MYNNGRLLGEICPFKLKELLVEESEKHVIPLKPRVVNCTCMFHVTRRPVALGMEHIFISRIPSSLQNCSLFLLNPFIYQDHI